MVLDKPLKGRYVNLRSVTEDDAEFILQIRNDPRISKYLPPLNITVEQQKAWIRRQREDDESYYFIIETKDGKKIGTDSIYNIHCGVTEAGRFCCVGGPEEIVETSILLSDFMFNCLKIESEEVWVYEDNKTVLSYNRKFGVVFYRRVLADDGRFGWLGCLTPTNYKRCRDRIADRIYSVLRKR